MTKYLEVQENNTKDTVLCEMIRFQTDRGLDKKDFNIDDELLNIIEEMLEAKGVKDKEDREFSKNMLNSFNSFVRYVSLYEKDYYSEPVDHSEVDAFCDIIEYATGGILKKGYNPVVSLDEMAKEINSRVGTFKNGKFTKDKSIEAQAKWYKADFTKAKLV